MKWDMLLGAPYMLTKNHVSLLKTITALYRKMSQGIAFLLF